MMLRASLMDSHFYEGSIPVKIILQRPFKGTHKIETFDGNISPLLLIIGL